MNDLIKFSARQVFNLLRSGEITPYDLLNAALLRIKETNPSINSIPTLCIDRAENQINKMKSTYSAKSNNSIGFLYGIPLVIKDLTDVQGVRTTMGSKIFADHIPKKSAEIIKTIEKNYGIILGKSNTPEFGAGANTFNEVFGKTRNPWNTNLSAGGSSGGSAAALAAGQVWLATGSDLGGSLRIPASYCSVVGLRPTPGLVHNGPKTLPFDNLSVDGPLARTVEDIALFLDTLSQNNIHAPLSLPQNHTSFLNAIDNPKLPKRIAFSHNLGIIPIAKEVEEIFTKTLNKLNNMGIGLEESTIDFTHTEKIFETLRAVNFAALFSIPKSHIDMLKPEIVWNINQGLSLTGAQIAEAETKRGELVNQFISFFKTFDLFICPTVILPPYDVNKRYISEINGKKLDNYIQSLILTSALTLTGCPIISIPCGFTSNNLPVGLQIMSKWNSEASLLSAAHIIEQELNIFNKVPIDPRTN
tara:strand:- start:3886 stop:5307 length:1422 start_codon:yes stop_codon:yes gene_type:complete